MANSERIYLIQGNDTDMSVCLRKGGDTPLPYDLTGASRIGLALTGHGLSFFARDIVVSGEDNNIISGLLAGDLLVGEYGLEVSFTLDGKAKRFRVPQLFEVVTYLSEDQDGTAEGEGDGISITVTVQPEVIEIAGPTGPRGKSAYEVWLAEGHTGTVDDFFDWLAAQTPNPDWDQNDPSKADYIKGRTHYEETSTITINNASLAWSGSTQETLDFWFYGTNVHIPRTSTGWGLTWEGGELFIDGDMRTGYEIGVLNGEEWSYNPFDPSYDQQPYPLGVDVVIASETVHKLDNKFLDMDSEPTTGSGKPVTSGGVKAAISNFITRLVNDLLNYYTKTETYTKAEVNQLVAGINNWEIVPVAQLPEASADTMHKIYLVPSSNPKTKNVKDEFITVEVSGAYSWEQIGSTTIDLTNYVTKQEFTIALADYVTSSAFTQALATKQDTLVSGQNIKTINGFSILGGGDLYFPGPVQSDWNEDDDGDDAYIKNKPTDMVKYTEQELTEAQKAQSRTNIAAASEGEVSQLRSEVEKMPADYPNTLNRQYTFTKTNINDTTGAYSGNSNYATIYYSCEENTVYKITNPSGGKLTVASSASIVSSGGTFSHFVVSSDATYLEYKTGTGEKYLYINYWKSTSAKTPGGALDDLTVMWITAKDQYSRDKVDAVFNGAIVGSRNIYNPVQHWLAGRNMETNGRIVTGYNNRGVVFIPVHGLSKVTIAIKGSGTTTTGCRYCWYDEDRTPTGNATGNTPVYGEENFSVLEVPGTAYFLGFLVYYAGCVLDGNGAPICMVQSGEQYTGYVPYNGTTVAQDVARPKDVYVCAKGSEAKYRKGCDYCCDGVNDELTIQSALDSVGICGTLYLAPGIYYIDSFPQQTDSQYCAIQYKLDTGSSPERRVKIKCFDQTPIRQDGYSHIRRCATLHINTSCYNALDANTQYSVIGCETSNGERVWNGNIFDIEGVAIEIPGNQKKVIAFDAYYAFCMMMFKCMGTAIPTNAVPSNPGVDLCIGIRCTKGSNFGQESQINTCAMYGFGQGVAVMGEHYVITNAKTIYNKYGFTFNWFGSTDGGYSHPNTLINCCSEMDMNYPYFGQNTQNQSLTFIDFNMEHRTAIFAMGGNRATELVPGSWRGTIHYSIKVYGTDGYSITGNSPEMPFWADGCGKNMESINDAQKKVVETVSALASFAPNFSQIVYVTELNKPLICTDPATPEWRDFTGAIVPLT